LLLEYLKRLFFDKSAKLTPTRNVGCNTNNKSASKIF
jgi:hypothetical protein